MLKLQHNRKTVKEYATAYELADELEKVIEGAPESWYKNTKLFLNQNAFALAIKGAKITMGNGWRFINDSDDKPLGEVKIA